MINLVGIKMFITVEFEVVTNTVKTSRMIQMRSMVAMKTYPAINFKI